MWIKNNKHYLLGGLCGLIGGSIVAYFWFAFTEYVFALKFITLGFNTVIYALFSLIGMSFIMYLLILTIVRQFLGKSR